MLMIYGKFADMNRYQPVDYARGTFVTNKIHATVWPDNDENRAALKRRAEDMNARNTGNGAHFEIRTDGGKRI
jgi:hypothetical protein